MMTSGSVQEHADATLRGMFKRFSHFFTYSLVNYPSFSAYLEPLLQMVVPSWRLGWHPVRVVDKRTETPSVITWVLKTSKHWDGFKAGQHVDLCIDVNGRRKSRTFSIASSPQHWQQTRMLELTTQIQPDGEVTPWMQRHVQVGQMVHISAASGELTAASMRPVLLIGAGSGITPMRSLLEDCAVVGRSALLLHFARGSDAFIFDKHLRSLGQRHPHIGVIQIDTQRQGRSSIEMLQRYCADIADRDVFVCGPGAMIQTLTQQCEALGVPADHIHHEYFGPTPLNADCLAGEVQGRVSFKHAGCSVETSLEAPRSILELAESVGLRPLHGCRRGLCHQCLCQKTHGRVVNSLTGEVSDAGSGSIQLCISVPLGAVEVAL